MKAFRPVHVWIALGVVIVDQLVKAAVRPRLGLFDSVTVIPGFFSLTRVHNTGAAFGLLNAIDIPYKTAVMALVQTAALISVIPSAAVARRMSASASYAAASLPAKTISTLAAGSKDSPRPSPHCAHGIETAVDGCARLWMTA